MDKRLAEIRESAWKDFIPKGTSPRHKVLLLRRLQLTADILRSNKWPWYMEIIVWAVVVRLTRSHDMNFDVRSMLQHMRSYIETEFPLFVNPDRPLDSIEERMEYDDFLIKKYKLKNNDILLGIIERFCEEYTRR